MNKTNSLITGAALLAAVCLPAALPACTGISFAAADGTQIQARTIEWGGYDLNSKLVVLPRRMGNVSYMPQGKNGLAWNNKYGAVGASTVMEEFVTEGVNEKGLNAGIFYFPHYGSLAPYNPRKAKKSVSDGELVRWMLTNFATVDEVLNGLKKIEIIPIGEPGPDGISNTGHWRIADASGRSVVLEITNKGERRVYENQVGILTNSPDYPWQETNLNNYVNLHAGAADTRDVNGVRLFPFGAGSALLGLPGDVTPPSRFVRAFFWLHSAPAAPDAYGGITQAFHILNNFDIPIGSEFAAGEQIPNLPSATQWTSAADLTHPAFYYRTMYNSQIRKVDLTKIDFDTVTYTVHPLDEVPREPMEELTF